MQRLTDFHAPWRLTPCTPGRPDDQKRNPDTGELLRDPYHVLDADGRVVARLMLAGEAEDPEGWAKARLIVAAPDLLKAARAATMALIAHTPRGDAAFGLLRAAIAKSEGRS